MLSSKHVLHFDQIRKPGVFQHQLSRGLGRALPTIEPEEVRKRLFSPTGRLVESKPELQELPR
jgi:hypothetical protein